MDRIEESNRFLLDSWDVMSHGSADFERERGGLIDVSWSGQPIIFFNLMVTNRTPATVKEFEDAVRDRIKWAQERKQPWMFAISNETMGGLMHEAHSVLERLGFTTMMPLTGMEADRLLDPARAKPKCTFLTETDETLGKFVMRLNEAAYQANLGEPGSFPLEGPGWWKAPDRMATVLVVDEQPSSCAAVFNLEGIRYVAFVATPPEFQRKGFAEAAMRDVLERSRAAGLNDRTYLHATAAGRPIYERMGYRPTAEYTVYALSEFLSSGH